MIKIRVLFFACLALLINAISIAQVYTSCVPNTTTTSTTRGCFSNVLSPNFLGNDTGICGAVNVTLNAPIAGSATDNFFFVYKFYDVNSGQALNIDTTQNTVNITQQGRYACKIRSVQCPNLIVNGDFEMGNAQFGSQYTFSTWNTTQGQYGIGTHPGWCYNGSFGSLNIPCPGHSDNNPNNMMFVDGDPNANQQVWNYTVNNILPNTKYIFYAWVQQNWASNPSVLQFAINGNLLGGTFSPGATQCQWQRFFIEWNSGASTTAFISINNQNTQPSGNDFSLDDIFFGQVQEFTDTITITSGMKPVVATTNAKCVGDTTTVKVYIPNDAGSQYSFTWTPAISNTTTDTLSIIKVVGSGTWHCDVIKTAPSSGCQGDTTITIVGPDSITVDAVALRNPTCPGSTNGSAKALVTGGTLPYSYSWNTSPVQSTQNITGLATGKYIVNVTDATNCIAKDSILLTSNPSPQDSFNVAKVCIGDSSVFNNLTTISHGTMNFFWNFGAGGNVSTAIAPKHLYTTCGQYVVTLVTTSDSGCVSVTTQTADVQCKPIPDFSFNNTCQGNVSSFTNNTLGTNTYDWDFGGGFHSNSQSAVFLFDSAGTFNVTLTAISSGLCQANTTKQITIYAQPIADFTTAPVCLGKTSSFIDGSSVKSPASINSWLWDFDFTNNQFTQDATGNNNITYTYPTSTSSSYTVALIVSTTDGCSDTISKQASIFPQPKAIYTLDSACFGVPTHFINNSTITAGGTIQSSILSYGDTTVANPNFVTSDNHTYTAAGTYVTQLTLISSDGCRDSIQQVATIFSKPHVDFASPLSKGCEPLCVQLNSGAQVVPNPPYFVSNYKWIVDNDTTTDVHRIACVNAKNGEMTSYDVKLIVYTNKGCTDTAFKQNFIEVYPLPIAGFYSTPQQVDLMEPTIDFIDTSKNGLTIKWDFGDKDSLLKLVRENIAHEYKDTGIYVVTQTVISNKNCIDTVKHIVKVNPAFAIYFPNAFSPNGDGKNEFFKAFGIGVKEINVNIYNRWGEMVFRIDNIENSWDGKDFKTNIDCKMDVYVWKAVYKNYFNSSKNASGTVTLLR